MRNYETALIFNASLSEGDLEGEVSKVVEIITKAGGTYSATQRWGRRMLTFPIKKQTEGVYFFVRWYGGEEVSAAIDWNLKINENCLRFLTIRLDDSRLAAEEPVMAEEAPGMDEQDADDMESDDESEQESED